MDMHANDNQGFLKQLSSSGRYNTEKLVIENSEQLIADVRSYLNSAGYDMALACLDLAIEKKSGKYRKDGKTPAIIHEVSQAIFTISLIEDSLHLEDPESVIALNFIHDLGEDFGIKPEELKQRLKNAGIHDNGKLDQLAADFNLMSKKYKGEPPKFETEFPYYETLKESQNASIAKLLDRAHNIATQIGVQTDERCGEYIRNTELIIKDYIEYASQKFSAQSKAYAICKTMLDTLCQITRYHLAWDEIGKELPSRENLMKEMPESGFKVPAGLNPILLTAKRVKTALQVKLGIPLFSSVRAAPAPQ